MSAVSHVVALTAGQISNVLKTQQVSHSEIASATWITYDIIISFGDEVEYIWKKQWTMAKVLYIFARYLPFAFQMALLALNVDGTTGLFWAKADCKQWTIVQAVILQVIITVVDIILMARVYALFERNRKLLIAMIVGYAAEIAYMSYVLSFVAPRLSFNDECFVIASPSLFTYYWVVSLAYETILFLLTLWKFAAAVKSGWGERPIMRQFVRDGTWAYTLIFVTMLINSMFYKFIHSAVAGICFTWLLSVLSFSGSRLILNPRKRYEEERSFELEELPHLHARRITLHLSEPSPISPRKYSWGQ